MGKSRNRFHAAKHDRSRLTRASTSQWQAPPIRFKRPPKQKPRKEVPESIDKETDSGSSIGEGPKSRKRNSRKAKRSLAGANHRQLASTSRKRRGKAIKNAANKTTTKKKTNSHKPKEAVSSASQSPGVSLTSCERVEESPTDYGDDRRTLIAYTDGSCLNVKQNAAAGIGVWWDEDDERNLSERCPGRQNSNRAEIFAVVRLLEETPMIGKKGRLVIRTDSRCAIECAMNWGPRWQTRGWTTASGDEVKDADMIQYMLALLSLRATRGEIVIFEHVRGHSKNVGNDGADALAKRGTKEATLPDRDWLARRRLVESIQARVRSS